MSIRAFYISCALAAAFAATPALSGSYDGNTYQSQPHMLHQHMGNMRLPKELKIMWHQQERLHLKSMPRDQRRGWLKRQWAAMSTGQRERKVAELRAKWNALPTDVRHAILEKKQQHHEQRRMQRAESNGGTRSANSSIQ